MPTIAPNTYAEAMKDPDQWLGPMQSEYNDLVSMGVWELVLLPPRANIVRCKWAYALKFNKSGEIEKFKARLVAKGFHQIPGVDYLETHSSVVYWNYIHIDFIRSCKHRIFIICYSNVVLVYFWTSF